MKGCTPNELDALEGRLGSKLPRRYREWLGLVGKQRKGPLTGTACRYGDLVGLTDSLPGFLEAVGCEHPLPTRFLCFYSHQGCAVAWVDLAGGYDDPVCWFWSEESPWEAEKRGSMMSFLKEAWEADGGRWPM